MRRRPPGTGSRTPGWPRVSRNCRIAEFQDCRKEKTKVLRLPFLQFCNPAILQSSRLFDRLDYCGNDLEQVADDAVVGNFEDRGVGILVDVDHRARSLHADQVLNRPGDAEREVQLRRNGLPGASDLTL